MAHFAKVISNRVVQVIVADPDVIASGVLGDPERYIQTSYNTIEGVHIDPETGKPSADQSKALRANFAAVGYMYDEDADVFHEPQPYPSWTLNTNGYFYEAPIAYPTDGGDYEWNETNQTWDAINE